MGLGRVIGENWRTAARARRNSRRMAKATNLVSEPLVVNDDGFITLEVDPDGGLAVTENGLALDYVANETPSGTLDGTNQTFTLANTPLAGTLVLMVNGLQVTEGATEDFTLDGAEITFNAGAIPFAGERLTAHYLKD